MKLECGGGNLRPLSEAELDLVAGGTGSSGITVTGERWSWEDYNSYFYLLSADWGSGVGGGGGGGGGEEPPPEDPPPDCHNVNPITGVTPPDGAKYYAPESATTQYLLDALNYLSTYAGSHTAAELLSEFSSMYNDPSHDHFIDFKDWGTSGGPEGSVSGGTMTYYSEAAGGDITASVFEPFGNWFYGFAGTWAGISPDVLYAAAALVQEGDTGWIPNDAPEDMPHVSAGILAAKNYADNPSVVIKVNEGDCTSGTTAMALGPTNLTGQVDPDYAYDNPTYRQQLWGYMEYRYNLA